MLYYKEKEGKMEISSCQSIQFEFDHEDMNLHAGQFVSNPSVELILADGWQEYHPVPVPKEEVSEEEKMAALLKLPSIGTEVVALDDESALALKALFPAWVDYIGKQVTAGERYYYDKRLWRCVQTHTAQDDWRPDTVPALFTEVSVEEFPEWRQPTGSQDAYNKGDKVTYEGQHYVSTIDGNVWSPKDYPQGWEKVD